MFFPSCKYLFDYNLYLSSIFVISHCDMYELFFLKYPMGFLDQNTWGFVQKRPLPNAQFLDPQGGWKDNRFGIDGHYQKAFVDAIITTKTTMNTRVSGQHGYKKDNVFDKMTEAEKLYSQYKWIIK